MRRRKRGSREERKEDGGGDNRRRRRRGDEEGETNERDEMEYVREEKLDGWRELWKGMSARDEKNI